MRLFGLYIAYGVCALVLQTTWLHGLPAANYQFDFLLLAVVYLGFSQEWRTALPIVIVFGVLYDVASAGPLGMALTSYLAIYTMLRMIIAKITYQTIVSRFAWVAIASLADKGVCAALIFVWGSRADIAELFLARAPVQALIDSTTGLLLIPFLAWYSELSWEKMFRPKGLVLD